MSAGDYKLNLMKKTCLLLSIICLSGMVVAQDSTGTESTGIKPDQPYHLDRASMQTTALEKLPATRKTQLKMFGLGGASSMYIIAGAQSSVAIPSADSMSFTISGKMALTVLGSTALLGLHKLKVEGEERHAVIKEKKGLSGGEASKSEKIEYIVKTDGDTAILVLSQKPAPGEYAFLNMRSLVLDKTIEVFCFRVE